MEIMSRQQQLATICLTVIALTAIVVAVFCTSGSSDALIAVAATAAGAIGGYTISARHVSEPEKPTSSATTCYPPVNPAPFGDYVPEPGVTWTNPGGS